MGMGADGRQGQYVAKLICDRCVGENIVSADATIEYTLTVNPPSQPYTVSP
jgi:hypothetical protein